VGIAGSRGFDFFKKSIDLGKKKYFFVRDFSKPVDPADPADPAILITY
jgi:hypothetical protein